MMTDNANSVRVDNKGEPGAMQRLLGFFSAALNSAQQSRSAPGTFGSLLTQSYASQFDKFSQRSPIKDQNDEMSKILGNYAKEHQKPEGEKKKVNKAMVKLFDKPIPNQDGQDGLFRCVPASSSRNVQIDPQSIYIDLLFSPNEKEHQNGVSALAFAFATIIALSSRRDLPDQDTRSTRSPYFDLSSLYGSNAREENSIRMKDGRGMLWPDCFCEDRLDTAPDAVPALLILWNRYHNYTAKQLLWYNERRNWKDPSAAGEGLLKQDDEIFDLARTITCINFVNMIKEDFMKGLLGLPFVGPSGEVDILYDAAANASMTKNSYNSTVESHFLYDFSPLAPPSLAGKLLDAATGGIPGEVDQDMRRRNYISLNRNKKGYFEDNDLVATLYNASESSAGAPGAKSIMAWARDQVVRKIQQARKWNVCTLNEFRAYLGLKPLASFEEWNSNPEVASAARSLYENIDNLELYPGLLAEETVGNAGFRFGRTMTWGLISDIVTRIRSDPLLTTKFSEQALTRWGLKDCLPDADGTRGSFRAMIPKLLARTLPRCYTFDSTYLLFPFSIPTQRESRLLERKKDYVFERPKKRPIKVLRTIEEISDVFNDPKNFRTPYKPHLEELTGGYGHMLGFDGLDGDLALHDQDLMMTLFSLLPDRGAARRIGAAFSQRANKHFLERLEEVRDGSSQVKIDVVKDVINATCVRWVCEIIYNYDLPGNDIDPPGNDVDQEKRRLIIEKAQKEEENVHEDFAAFYTYVFRSTEPETGWTARGNALQARDRFAKHLEKRLTGLRDEKSASDAGLSTYLRNSILSCGRTIWRICEEYGTKGKILSKDSAQTFLDRIMKAAEIAPLSHLENADPDLEKFRNLYQRKNLTEEEEEKSAREDMEKKRVIANVIGLAYVVAVQLSKACSQVVDFYMKDEYEAERQELIKLCRDNNKSSNEAIMGYVREAQRIGQRFGLWRNAVLPSGPIEVSKGPGRPVLRIEDGDRVFADFTRAHKDPKLFHAPEKVIHDRKERSYVLGLGVHKCPAGSFIDEAIPEMLKVIFGQEYNPPKRHSQDDELKVGTLHSDGSPWDTEIFMDGKGGYSYYPKKLVLQYKRMEKTVKPWKSEEGKFFAWINIVLSMFFAILALHFFIRFISSLSGVSMFDFSMPLFRSLPSLATSKVVQVNTNCSIPGPLKDIEPWKLKSFRPRWFGLFGEPSPIIYRTPRGRHEHLVSFMDIDKRDIEIRAWVDYQDRGVRPVDIDPTINCGDDIGKCLELGFAAGLVLVPPGRHTVIVEIVKQNGTFEWGKDREKRIMWAVQRCP